MDSTVKMGLLGAAAAFILYKYTDIFDSIIPAATLPAGSTPVVTAPDAATAVLPTLRAKMLANTGGDVTLTGDAWNYVYRAVRGVSGPDPNAVWPGRDRTITMQLDEYLRDTAQHGVAGIRRKGLGANYVGGDSMLKGRYQLTGIGAIVPYQYPSEYMHRPPYPIQHDRWGR